MPPVAAFIARVREADSYLRSLTKDEAEALPAKAAAAAAVIRVAIRDLDASQQDTADSADDTFSLERFSGDHVPGTRPPTF